MINKDNTDKAASKATGAKLLKDALTLYLESKAQTLGLTDLISILEISENKAKIINSLTDNFSVYQNRFQLYYCNILAETVQHFLNKTSPGNIDVVIISDISKSIDNLKACLADLNLMLGHNFIIFMKFSKDEIVGNNLNYQDWINLLTQYQLKNIYILGDDTDEERLIMAESDIKDKKVEYLIKKEDSKPSRKPASESEVAKDLEAPRIDNLILDLKNIIAEVLVISSSDIDIDDDFNDLGLDSILASEVTSKLNAVYKINMNSTTFFSCTTISKLANEMIEKYHTPIYKYYDTQPQNHTSDGRIQTYASDISEQEINHKTEISDKEIAIIGMSGLFPGADNIDEFWNVLLYGKEALSELPKNRWKNTEFENINIPKAFIGRAGLITRADKFDAEFFKISPMEAKAMDPRQRTLLECVYHVVEDAGYKISDLANSKVGVFIGTENNEYEHYLGREHPLFIVGASNAMVANRISYHFNFTGISQTVDGSCASGLLAFHNAVRLLQLKEIDYAIVGCSTIIYSPIETIEGLKAQFLAPDGHCRTFDQNANGWVIGETVVCTLLKPLAKASQDLDHIYAIVKGTAVNHGGKVSSVTAPNPKKQAENAIVALQDAGVDSNTITYISAHGVGSSLIDTAEIEALKKAYTRPFKLRFCALGSVTPNIGNVNSASGLAGLIQAVMAMKYKIIPPNININQENQSFDLENSPFYLPKEPIKWNPIDQTKAKIPRRAAVNSFGITGTNAHLILEEYVKTDGTGNKALMMPCIIPLSAKTKDSLRRYIYTLIDYLETHPNLSLPEISYTLQVGREAFSERVVIIAKTLDELKERLRVFYNRLLSKLTTENEMLSKLGVQETKSVLNTVEDSSTKLTTQFASVVKFRENLNDFSTNANIFYIWPEDRNPEELKKLKKEYTEESLASLDNSRKQEELAILWSKGLDVPWNLLPSSDRINRISLPGYAFNSEYYPVIPNSSKCKEISHQTPSIELTNQARQALIEKIEEIIAQTLQLKTEKIDINMHFKEYGIDSMTGMIVTKVIQNTIIPNLPMTALLNYPTIKSLAEYIEKQYPDKIDVTKYSDNLPPFIVPIQQTGNKKRSFWVHELFGDVGWLIQFARGIGEDYPIYGLEIGEINEEDDKTFSIEKIAANYIESIRKVQSEGPYILGGYSGGGLIAYEMAYQLAKQGQKVDKLIILDTFMPGSTYFDEIKDITFNHMDHHALFLVALASRYETRSGSTASISYNVLLPMEPEKRIEYVAKYLVENTNSMRTFESQLREVNKNIKVSQYLATACYEYKFKKFPEILDLILIRCKSFVKNDSKSGLSIKVSTYDHGENWQTYIPNPINIYDIDCDHFELIHSPYLHEVTKICANIIGGNDAYTRR